MRRGLIRFIVILVLASWSEPAAAKPVTFAYQTPTLSGTLPIMIGVDFGFFAAQGLEVKPVFIRGGATAIAALIGGDVDYTFAAAVPTVRAIAQGAPLMIVGGIQPYIDYTLIGGKGITSVNDLKGKIVGVTGPGGFAAVPLEPRLWKRDGSTPPLFLFWNAWSWSIRAFRCCLTSDRSCRDFPLL
jgi:NitT/TauT family transport system substrate-binding protein